MTDPRVQARAQLDLLLTAAIGDTAWRREIIGRYVDWLLEAGWRPPATADPPRAAGGPVVPPNDEFRAARAQLRTEPRPTA